MNTSKNLLISILFLFVFIIELSSVYSNEQKIANSFRYLEDEDLDTDSLEEKNNKIIYYDCKDEEIRKSKCELKNMNCTEDYNCTCKNGYVTLDNSKYCEIARKKKQLTAFLLELFVGFGAGHFYRHHYLMASLKLVAFVFGIYVICLFPLTAKCVTDCCDSDCLVVMVSIIFYLYALGLAFWYIWDLVYSGKNKYKDCSNGKDKCVDLIHW
jgi:uncharacterized membrane protein (Fun14 family)